MTGEIGGALRAQYFDTKAMARAEPFAMLHADAPGGEE
jgi:hypothetical protein